ncbi:MAG TPA: hypothetical protein VF370_05920 [Candidatus Cryosericum sp.]
MTFRASVERYLGAVAQQYHRAAFPNVVLTNSPEFRLLLGEEV